MAVATIWEWCAEKRSDASVQDRRPSAQLRQVDSEKLAQVLAEIKQLSKDEITEILTSEKNVVGEKE